MKIIDKIDSSIDELSEKLLEGELIVIPTETVYGLAANALNSDAVSKIFKVKGRPQDNPLIIHTFSKEKIFEYTINQPEYLDKLIDKFLPGPLTLVLEKHHLIPDIVSAELKSVGIRIPNKKVTLDLLKKVKVPLAAPSANKSGRPSPTKIQHVIDDYSIDNQEIYACVDGGDCDVGIESTIIKCEKDKIVILRPGLISIEDLKKVIDIEIEEYKGNENLSPGIKYKHYSPDIPISISDKYISDKNVLNLYFSDINLNADNLKKISENNLYDIYREAEKFKYKSINIILTEDLKQRKGLFNRILKSIDT